MHTAQYVLWQIPAIADYLPHRVSIKLTLHFWIKLKLRARNKAAD